MKASASLLCVTMLIAIICCTIEISTSTPAAGAGTQENKEPDKIRLYSAGKKGYIMSDKVIKSDAEWRKQLTPEQFHVTREKGTERAHTGATWNNHEKGIYQCVCCGNDLYSSEHKYDSDSGWPSFWQPIVPENVTTRPDNSLFSKRTEVVCSHCDAHLGHVFHDGPKRTGLRYCMNLAAMKFVKMP